MSSPGDFLSVINALIVSWTLTVEGRDIHPGCARKLVGLALAGKAPDVTPHNQECLRWPLPG
jgi:hypothetical protein